MHWNSILTTFIFVLITSKTLQKQLKWKIHKFSIWWIFIKIISFRNKKDQKQTKISVMEWYIDRNIKVSALADNVWNHGFTNSPAWHSQFYTELQKMFLNCLIGYIFLWPLSYLFTWNQHLQFIPVFLLIANHGTLV